jgi:hypothetical protein
MTGTCRLQARGLEIHCVDRIRVRLVIVFWSRASVVTRCRVRHHMFSLLAHLGPAFPGTHMLLNC